MRMDQYEAVSKRIAREKKETEEEAVSETLESDEESDILLRKYYADMLASISLGGYWPEDEEKETYYNFLVESNGSNYFSICDIDGDGVEELLVKNTSGSMADLRFVIYQYDLEHKKIRIEFEEYISEVFYDNGILIDYFSHSQLGRDMVPFNIYQYDPVQDTYVSLGYADSWNKDSFAVNPVSGEAFSDQIDLDGDGNIYYIADAVGNVRTVDGAEYKEWEQSLFGSAKEVEVDWQDLKAANYSVYTNAYLQYHLSQVDEDPNLPDLGYVYMSREGSLDEVMNVLSSTYGIEMQEDVEGMGYIGSYNGNEVIFLFEEDGGSISYQNIAVENLSVCGLHPGMKVSEIEPLLKKYGFEPSSYGYSTGDAHGNYFIYYVEENGKIQSISIYRGSRYTG